MSYLFLNDTLVAPIVDMESNTSTRSVWIPPGHWQDARNGTVVAGPLLATVTQPFDRIPMLHRRGSFTVTTSRPGLRVASQDWSELTLVIFPDLPDLPDLPGLLRLRVLLDLCGASGRDQQTVPRDREASCGRGSDARRGDVLALLAQ